MKVRTKSKSRRQVRRKRRAGKPGKPGKITKRLDRKTLSTASGNTLANWVAGLESSCKARRRGETLADWVYEAS